MEKMKVQYNKRNILIAVLVAVLSVLFVIIVNLIFSLTIVQMLLLCWIITTFYSLFAFFILDNPLVKQVEFERIIEKPVIKEVFVEKPVIKEVPVYLKELVREPVIRKRLNIPKYNYLGSSETKRYHKRNCRLGKLIKKKYKISNNNQAYFKKKHFKPCKICIKKH